MPLFVRRCDFEFLEKTENGDRNENDGEAGEPENEIESRTAIDSKFVYLHLSFPFSTTTLRFSIGELASRMERPLVGL